MIIRSYKFPTGTKQAYGLTVELNRMNRLVSYDEKDGVYSW